MSEIETTEVGVERLAGFLGDPFRRSAWATGDVFEEAAATLRALAAERDALAARVALAEGMAEALEVGLSALPTDMTGGPRHRARTALAAWRAAKEVGDG